jgi:hypothetical protein
MAEETPERRRAEAALDEATREVAAAELDKEARREVLRGRPGISGLRFRWFPRMRSGDPDPGDERGLREVLHENDPKE